jgi:hypothetical protein
MSGVADFKGGRENKYSVTQIDTVVVHQIMDSYIQNLWFIQ